MYSYIIKYTFLCAILNIENLTKFDVLIINPRVMNTLKNIEGFIVMKYKQSYLDIFKTNLKKSVTVNILL